MYRLRDVADLQSAPLVLGDRLDCFHLVVDLVKHADIAADEVTLYLPGHHEHRGRGGVRRAQRTGGVEEAGAGDDKRRAKSALAARAGVTVRHVAGGLLMPGRNEANSRLIAKRRHDPVHLDPG